MSEDKTTFEDIEKVFSEVCDLTSDSCDGALDKYKKHNDPLKLTLDVFKAINECKSDKCITNKDEILARLKDFLVNHRG